MSLLPIDPDEITIRRLDPDGVDRAPLRRLAERDSIALPSGPLLGAWRDGQLLAAIGLQDQTVLADPFVASAGAASILRLRAAQLRVTRRGRGGPLRQLCSSGAIVSPAPFNCSQ